MIYAPIEDLELQQHLTGLEQDGLHIFTAADGLFRGGLFHGTQFVNRMRAQHRLGILETMVLGQASLCAALMIQTMKGRESLQFRYETDGIARGFSVEANSLGSVRGYLLQNPIPLDTPLESWDLAPFFGKGTITVSRFRESGHEKSPETYTGVAEIKYRNIAKDLTWYFHQSEQINTAFNTGIRFDSAGRVIGAGGFFIQRMPAIGGIRPAIGGVLNQQDTVTEGTYDELTIRMERAFSACPPLGDWFSERGNCEDIIFGLLREFNPQTIAMRSIVFDCPCSKEHYRNALVKLPPSELTALKKGSAPIEIVCRNCSSTYTIPLDEL
ncbi:MAG: Hsp33 family molecular chaperone HslO [Treponema sp.]